MTQDDDGVHVSLEDGKTFDADLLLVAVGRGPRTADLGYEEQGLTLDRGFVITNERLHTGVGNIYAVATSSGLQLAHRASPRASSSPRRSRASTRSRSSSRASRASPTPTRRSRPSA